MTVAEVLASIEIKGNKIKSLSTGNEYDKFDFINMIAKKLKWDKSQKKELEARLCDFLKAQSDQSKYIEKFLDEYDFQFADGVYVVRGEVKTMDDLYKLFWDNERLLPDELDNIIQNIEKICPRLDLQPNIYEVIKNKAIEGKSNYLASLDILYPKINFRSILYNILVPNTQPYFHIFYDDGVGGTGKSTLLEVITKIVGEKFTSNVLLDQFGNRFIFSNMLGKYVNIGDDNGKNDELQNVGTLKSMITGNRITIDRKNITPIEVRIFAKQLFATNILPYIDFTDGGIMRRLNIVPMNEVIPKSMKLCEFDEEEIGHIVYEVLQAGDMKTHENVLAITSHPLYRFLTTTNDASYSKYRIFCIDYGFKPLNIINFEVKSKFIRAYIERKTKPTETVKMIEDKEIKDEEIPF